MGPHTSPFALRLTSTHLQGAIRKLLALLQRQTRRARPPVICPFDRRRLQRLSETTVMCNGPNGSRRSSPSSFSFSWASFGNPSTLGAFQLEN